MDDTSMEEKSFVWTSDLTKRLFDLRFENDWLFKKLKQPWGYISLSINNVSSGYKSNKVKKRKKLYHHYQSNLDNKKNKYILQKSGFPEEMTIQHVRKKWSYTYDSYKIAKRTKNKGWKYYKSFDKHFGKTKVLDKYDSWNDEWRLKLITCISEAKELKLDFQSMWRVTERALRCQHLPIECCIQDIKGLWHHIKVTFNRKHRLKMKKGSELSEWPLYVPMLEYFRKHEAEYLRQVENETGASLLDVRLKGMYKKKGYVDDNEVGHEFQWSKDITETFIQIRLQQDWLFRERKWAWNELRNIMLEEHGFPKTLSSRELSRKWAATFAEYQKAKATDNKSWVYYNIFELYLGEGNLSLNPLVGWQEEWTLSLISARTEYEHLFQSAHGDRSSGWKEVEKRLRASGIPLEHSLLDLEEIWIHLVKTYRWKRKFANKGILNEQWPYYDAMAKYMESQTSVPVKKQRREDADVYDEAAAGDDNEDDLKLLDLKQRLSLVKPKYEYLEASQCRACSSEEGCVGVFEHSDADGVDLAFKLKIICGVEVDQSDALPTQLCLNCFRELENAYKFRRRCQEIDKDFRHNSSKIKIELKLDNNEANNTDITDARDIDADSRFDDDADSDTHKRNSIKTERVMMKRKKKARRLRYDYWKICEVCGKHTRNLISHLDTHSNDKLYSCDICEKKFKFKSGLIIHKAIHDPTPKKTCEVCGKTFHILAQYRRHFVYHANERKYSCETCGKRFNTMDILKVHNRSHTDERPFSCQDCGKTFRTAGCVSRHKRIVHRTVKQ